MKSDGEIVHLILQGEKQYFRFLIERYQRPIFQLVLRLMAGDRDEAEELTQEAFVRSYQHLDHLLDPERYYSWLYRIARTAAQDRLRRLAVEKRALGHQADVLRRSQTPNSDRFEIDLSVLTPEELQAIQLRYYEGRTYQEIANLIGKSFSQVDHLIRRARKRLERSLIQEKNHDRLV